jgi:hypothetical protein
MSMPIYVACALFLNDVLYYIWIEIIEHAIFFVVV